MAINKEWWLDVILEGFYPEANFLTRSVDLSEHVENAVLHLAEAGVDPEVLVDNTLFPIPVATREDLPKEITLHTLDTKNTVIRSIEEMETSYNKSESVVRGHKNSLLLMKGKMAAWNWAPQENTNKTPVLKTTGPVNAWGYKALTFEDILTLVTEMTARNIPQTELVLVLCPKHMHDLQVADIKQYREMVTSGKLFGTLSYYVYSDMPHYVASTGKKLSFGSAVTDAHAPASILYHEKSVCRADGKMDMFSKEKDPLERGDVMGFQSRFQAMPMRTIGISAIYSDKPAAQAAMLTGDKTVKGRMASTGFTALDVAAEILEDRKAPKGKTSTKPVAPKEDSGEKADVDPVETKVVPENTTEDGTEKE